MLTADIVAFGFVIWNSAKVFVNFIYFNSAIGSDRKIAVAQGIESAAMIALLLFYMGL